jgi:hypothetical protein
MAGTAIPFCWMGGGGMMSYSNPESEGHDDPQCKSKIGLISLSVSLVALAYFLGSALLEKPRSLRPIIDAEPYVWPEGCPIRQYKDGEYVSSKCLVSEYQIHDWYDRGLPQPSRTPKNEKIYYRIGSDAVSYVCSWGDMKKCWILKINHNFFKNKHNNQDI